MQNNSNSVKKKGVLTLWITYKFCMQSRGNIYLALACRD